VFVAYDFHSGLLTCQQASNLTVATANLDATGNFTVQLLPGTYTIVKLDSAADWSSYVSEHCVGADLNPPNGLFIGQACSAGTSSTTLSQLLSVQADNAAPLQVCTVEGEP
jgi:hypothetical protein